jgi:hypothetical protein
MEFSLRPRCLQGSNTERTEHLCELCVEALLSKEGTEETLVREIIFAAHEEVDGLYYREVLGHEDVAQDFETRGGSKFVQRLNEVPAKAWGVEKRRAAIGAGSKIMEMIKPVIRAWAWHQEILHPAVAHMPETGMYAPPARLTVQ